MRFAWRWETRPAFRLCQAEEEGIPESRIAEKAHFLTFTLELTVQIGIGNEPIGRVARGGFVDRPL